MRHRGRTQPGFLRDLTEGRSGRQQFWSFYAFVAVPPAAVALAGLAMDNLYSARLMVVYAVTWVLLCTVPVVIAMARRFHDMGWRGAWAIPQFGIAVLAFVFASAYPNVIERPRVVECRASIDQFLGLGLGNRLNLPTELQTPHQRETSADREKRQAACNLERELQQAYDKRKDALVFYALALAGFAHIATLVLLARPSDPNPNNHGPNPREVTE